MAPQKMTAERRRWWWKMFISLARRLRRKGREYYRLAAYFQRVAQEYR